MISLYTCTVQAADLLQDPGVQEVVSEWDRPWDTLHCYMLREYGGDGWTWEAGGSID